MPIKRKSRVAGAPQEAEPDEAAELELYNENSQDVGVVEQGLEDPELEQQDDDEEEDEDEADEGIQENGEGFKYGGAISGEEEENPFENRAVENGGGEEELEIELEEEPLEKLLEPFSKDQLVLLFKEAAAKHPDIMEKLFELADTDPFHCKVFVHGLGWDANAETLTSVFGKYGEIEDCKVVKDKSSGKSKGYGFILFKQRNGARCALKEPQKVIEGRMTSCQLASAGPPVQSSSVPPVPAFSSPNVSEVTQKKIYVSNVSAELDPNKLFEFFSRFGEIEEGPLGLDKQTGKPRGFCLFVYKTFEGAKRALEEPHKNFEGQMLHCQKAKDGPKYIKGHFNQQQQHHQGDQGYHNPTKKGRYLGPSGGHMMAPSAGPPVPPPIGFNPAVAPAAFGHAVAALLATQGPGLGIGNFLGGVGAGVSPQGVPPIVNIAGYGGQGGAVGYGGQVGMQGGYGGQPQIGPGGARPHQGGAPYR